MARLNPKAILKTLGAKATETPTGMSDSVRARVDGKDEAALSVGEYIIDASTVSLIGDGDTEAGTQILDKTIEELRQAKMGKTEQPKPTAELFKGGKVKLGKKAYADGGKVLSPVNKNQVIPPGTEPPNAGMTLHALLSRMKGQM